MNPFVMTKPASRAGGGVPSAARTGPQPGWYPPRRWWPGGARLHDDTATGAELVTRRSRSSTRRARASDLEGVSPARVPVMLRSGLCRLSGLRPAGAARWGSARYDETGTLCGGGKKVVVSEIGVTNRLRTMRCWGQAPWRAMGRVRSVTGEGDFPRTLEVAVLRKTKDNLVVNGRVSQQRQLRRGQRTAPLCRTDNRCQGGMLTGRLGGSAGGVLLEALLERYSRERARAAIRRRSRAPPGACRAPSASPPSRYTASWTTPTSLPAHGDKAATWGDRRRAACAPRDGAGPGLTFNKRVEQPAAR
jgi:hypothetical protein